MAVSESSSRIEKRVLKCSNIRISGIRWEIEQLYRISVLAIENFYQLKKDLEYFAPILHKEGELYFIKKRNHHMMKIVADDLRTVTVSILYGKSKSSDPFQANEIENGVYLIVMPSSVVENEQNTFLKEGKVLIHIGCAGSDTTLKRSHDCSGKREKLCEERISKDLNFVHAYPNATDILLHVEDKIIHIPKALLACRSNYFMQNPNSDNNIHLNSHYGAMSCAVKYLYTGTLSDIDETNEKEIYSLLEVASSLKINSLKSKCFSLINNLIIRGDVESNVSG